MTTIAQHDRTIWHSGTEDTTTAVLAAPIGRYATGTTVQDVLADLAARLSFIETAGSGTIVKALTLDAYVFKARTFTIDAIITSPIHSLTLNASIHATVGRSLTLDAYFLDHAGGATTLAAPVSSGASSITVTNPGSFPFVNGFVIDIGGTQYTVTGGAGTTTWTIFPNAAANYSSGTAVMEVC